MRLINRLSRSAGIALFFIILIVVFWFQGVDPFVMLDIAALTGVVGLSFAITAADIGFRTTFVAYTRAFTGFYLRELNESDMKQFSSQISYRILFASIITAASSFFSVLINWDGSPEGLGAPIATYLHSFFYGMILTAILPLDKNQSVNQGQIISFAISAAASAIAIIKFAVVE